MVGTGYYRKTPSWFRSLVPILAVYFSYIFFSKLGDFFVIPPGFVSVMWPAAGIAIGFVYALGNKVAIGVFLARFTMVISVYSEPDVSDIIITLFLSVGATLHAVIGALLIRRFTEAEFYMGSLKDIIIFLFIAGPVACVITAAIGGLTFINFASLPSDQFIEFFKTWWMGDVFGVIVFAPLTVIILSHFQREQTVTASTLLTMIVPLIVSISIFIALFNVVKDKLIEHTFEEYTNTVSNLVGQFNEVLTIGITKVNATASFIEASDGATAAEFNIFTRPLLNESSGLYGLSWLPKISNQIRGEFVESIRNQGYENFKIKSSAGNGEFKVSGEQKTYFPITYTEPYALNKLAHGLDVYGRDKVGLLIRQRALNAARNSGEAKATSRFSIMQKKDKYGFAIFYPIYKQTDIIGPPEHIGFIRGVFVFPNLVKVLTEESSLIHSDFFITEISDELRPILLFDSRTPDYKEGSIKSYDLDRVVHSVQEFEVAGKKWKVTFIKNQSLLAGEYEASLWALAGGGALFNTLFLIILMMIVSQNNFVQKLVEQRTRDLRHANEELEEFAYRTSHDLRSPIVSSVTLLGLADEAIHTGNIDVARNSISHAQKSLSKLEVLISDILTLTQIGSANEADVLFDITDAIDDAISKLDHADGFEKLSIERNIKFTGKVATKPSRLKLILENLISNAAKYQDPAEDNPTLKISCYSVADHLYLEFSDNGLGIAKEYRHQIFDMFKRFHPKVADGTGLGLYLMKRSARVLNGEISYHPLVKGSLFRLVIPIKQMEVGS